jgi:hypothetical protein
MGCGGSNGGVGGGERDGCDKPMKKLIGFVRLFV